MQIRDRTYAQTPFMVGARQCRALTGSASDIDNRLRRPQDNGAIAPNAIEKTITLVI